jgi:hypothetical protein
MLETNIDNTRDYFRRLHEIVEALCNQKDELDAANP